MFLAGYVNHINAQNINCKSIAGYLDKSKYEVKTLRLVKGDHVLEKGFSTIPVYKSFFRLSNLVSFLYAIIWCDIAYLPKHHTTPKIIFLFSRIFNKTLFTTIEGNMCDTSKQSMVGNFGGKDNLISYFKNIKNIFGITEFIISNAKCGVLLNKQPLYLGVEGGIFDKNEVNELKQIIFIGNLISRKRVHEIIDLSYIFPDIIFHIVGEGPLMSKLLVKKSSNLVFHFKQNHSQINSLLPQIDLLFLPSKSEGFPKVILEMASAGIPSLVYSDYGAYEWIDNDKNGFIVSDYDEVILKLKELKSKPNLLKSNSQKCLKLAQKFDWKIRIKDWEEVIDKLVHKHD